MLQPNQEIRALIHLLADDHPDIVETARRKLTDLGEGACPYLKEAAESDKDPKVRVEAAGVLERIRLGDIGHQWEKIAVLPDEEIDLEGAAFLLAKVSYPDLDPQPYARRLDALAELIRPKFASTATPRENLSAFNKILFKEEKFRGNRVDYFDPENSYLNRVLDRKLGIPLSLSVLYLLVAKRLGLSLAGAGIPGHFMLKYQDEKTQFFIDPFNDGRFLSRPECAEFIVEAGFPYQVDFLEGIGSRDVLARMLRNLILIYVDRQEETLEKTLTRFLDILYPNS